mgnify:CR=1 FL=1
MNITKDLTEKVRTIVNKHDQIKLLKIGCPLDEYDPEIKKILPALKKVTNLKEFQKKVYHIFVEMFDKRIAGPKRNYEELGREIFGLKKIKL